MLYYSAIIQDCDATGSFCSSIQLLYDNVTLPVVSSFQLL